MSNSMLPPYLRGVRFPVVFEGALNRSEWDSDQLTLSALAKAFAGARHEFRLGRKNRRDVVWEGECDFVTSSLSSFQSWATSSDDHRTPSSFSSSSSSSKRRRTKEILENGEPTEKPDSFDHYDPALWWCYFDYKYMADFESSANMSPVDEKRRKKLDDIMEAPRWDEFGFNGRDGKDSTIWIGSPGAFTQCHQDSYGVNLVAQIEGRKKWTLFPPEASPVLEPTRIPYEESTVFSRANVGGLDGVSAAPRVQVTLNPGDVLFVPHRWWHHVENLDLAVSVNTWIEIPRDVEARCKEAIVKTLVNAVMSSTDNDDVDESDDDTDDGDDVEKGCSRDGKKAERRQFWLNPTEIKTSTRQNIEMLNLAMSQFSKETSEKKREGSRSSPSAEEDCVETCKCLRFTPAKCQCESRLRGALLKPTVVGGARKKESDGAAKMSEAHIDATSLVDALASEEVVQLIFEKLKPV